jgi:nucleoside-triphosphatase THEP1
LPPGVGKTTAVIRVGRALKERGVKVGGIVSRELRSNTMRIVLRLEELRISSGHNDIRKTFGKIIKLSRSDTSGS